LGPTFWSLEEFGGALRKKREGGGEAEHGSKLIATRKGRKKVK